MATIGEINVRIGAVIKPLEKALRKAEYKMRRSGRQLANIGQELSQSISIPLVGIGAAAIKAFSDFEALEKGLASTMGSAEAARKELELLRKVAQKPGIDLTQAVKGSVRLQSVGISAETARKALSEFGNAIAVAGGRSTDLDGVTLALTQIISKGKISAEEINQLAERVPQVRKAIEDAFGTSDSEQLQKMGVGAEEFVTKVTAAMENVPRASDTMRNSLNNAGQAMTQFLVDIGRNINEAFDIQGKVKTFSDGLNRLAERFSNLDARTKKTILKIAGFAAAIGPAIFILGKMKLAIAAILGTLKAVFSLSTLSMLLSPWTLAIAGIAGLAILIVKNWDLVKKTIVQTTNRIIELYNTSLALRIAFQGLGAGLKNIWVIAKTVIKNLLSGFNAVFQAINLGIQGKFSAAGRVLSDHFKKGFKDFKDTGQEIGENIGNAIGKAVNHRMEKVSEAVFTPIEKKTADLKKEINNLMGAATGGGGSGGSGFKTQINDIKKWAGGVEILGNKWEGLTLASKSAIDQVGKLAMLEPTMSRFQQYSEQIKAFWQDINTAFSGILERGLADAFSGIGDAIGVAIQKGQSFGQLMKGVGMGVLTTLSSMLEHVGKMAIQTGIAILGIKTALKSLNPFVAIAAGVALVALAKVIPKKLAQTVPGFARGVNNFGGGLAMVGEQGPELVNLPRGSDVIPNHLIKGGGQNLHVTGRLVAEGGQLIALIDEARRQRSRAGIF